jgi:dTDP-glucose pyrophosphorylase
MDYSVFDALRAGFGKIVFVIRKDFEQDFRNVVLSKYEDKVPCEICFQSLDKVPEGYTYNPERTKPWGTNHAVLMGKDLIHEPFAVINADDFYGKESFQVLADFLTQAQDKKGEYCMVGYHVANTLSENGSVSRGVCSTDDNGYLTDVVERTHIEQIGANVVYTEDGVDTIIAPNTPVSMNMWGFTPDYFDFSDAMFREFLDENINNLKAEYFIPSVVNHLIITGNASVKVMSTKSKWFGVTYPSDRPHVVEKLAELHATGEYPEKLFE